MKNKLILFVFLFCFNHLIVNAKNVSLNDAKTVAKNAYSEKYQNRFPSEKSQSIGVTDEFTISENGKAVYYIFNTDNNGFVIIAADDIVQPVLGYSFENNYSVSNQPPQFISWMKTYALQIADAVTMNLIPSNETKGEWAKYNKPSSVFSAEKDIMDVAELLTTTWDQGSYYNGLCPVDAAGPSGRVYAGCVATSMAQVMNYYKYPSAGSGSHSYYSSYGSLSANFASTTYDWSAMANQLHSSNTAVATLLYHCGVSVDMNYAPDGSGAQMTDATYSLKNYFKYSNTIATAYKNSYSTTTWANLLKTELDNKRPMMYAGYDPSSGSGHAWVCDGYQGTNFFHFNWGWSGYYNGFYYLDALNPGGNVLTNGQHCIYNIFPGSNYPSFCSGSKTLTAPAGIFNDGSGPILDYQNNADCSWLISPTDVDHINLTFDYLNTENTNDVITIYNGSNSSAPVLGTYSGSTLPAAISSTSPTVYVHFTTDGATATSGWQISYTSAALVFCNGTTLLTAPSDTFSDGSGGKEYSCSSNCKWKIEPSGAASVTINFTSFRSELNKDFVKIYDPVGTVSTLLATYSGTTIPASVTSSSGKMLVIFTSNSTGTDAGWSANYTSTLSGIEEIGLMKNISVFPNPAENNLNISLNSIEEQSIRIELLNAVGQIIFSENNENVRGEIIKTINLSGISKGIYLIRLISGNQQYFKKVVIN